MSAHLFVLGRVPNYSRLTHILDSRRTTSDVPGHVVTAHHIDLPADQDVDIESDFLSGHLPFSLASVGGRYPDGRPWLVVLQHSGGLRDVDDAEAVGVLAQSMDAALVLNPGAQAHYVGEWSRRDLLQLYKAEGIPRRVLDLWSTADLAMGLVAQCCGADLADLPEGFVAGCAYPEAAHPCEGDVFTDVLAAWHRGLLAQAERPPG